MKPRGVDLRNQASAPMEDVSPRERENRTRDFQEPVYFIRKDKGKILRDLKQFKLLFLFRVMALWAPFSEFTLSRNTKADNVQLIQDNYIHCHIVHRFRGNVVSPFLPQYLDISVDASTF